MPLDSPYLRLQISRNLNVSRDKNRKRTIGVPIHRALHDRNITGAFSTAMDDENGKWMGFSEHVKGNSRRARHRVAGLLPGNGSGDYWSSAFSLELSLQAVLMLLAVRPIGRQPKG
jgi:hypothetical protein